MRAHAARVGSGSDIDDISKQNPLFEELEQGTNPPGVAQFRHKPKEVPGKESSATNPLAKRSRGPLNVFLKKILAVKA